MLLNNWRMAYHYRALRYYRLCCYVSL